MLLRRNAVLVVFGFVHAALLYFGDFLAAYGLAGMLATAELLRRSDRVLGSSSGRGASRWCMSRVLSAVALYQWLWGAGAPGAVDADAVPSLVASSYVDSARARLSEWPLQR